MYTENDGTVSYDTTDTDYSDYGQGVANQSILTKADGTQVDVTGIDPSTYTDTMDTSGWGNAVKSLFTNKDGSFNLQGAGGILGAIAGGLDLFSPNKTPTGYQGGIPNLVATRNMITAPPSDRRPGAGGVNYGGDVTYTRAPAGQDPWVNLRGDSGFIAPIAGQANIPKGTGGNDPQSMANSIGYTLPQGWKSFSPQEKIAWFNQNNVSVDQLRAAGVPQSDIDYMLANGYGSAGTNAGIAGATTGATESNTGATTSGTGIDALAAAQTKAQTQAGNIGLTLPPDWSTYDAAQKIDWFNRKGTTPAQLVNAGVDQGTIDWMLSNGLTTGTQQSGIGASDGASNVGINNRAVQNNLETLGVTNYAMGGMAKGRYLQGETDGMADELPAKIGRDQPAALSHGEFVIPADVVSHMGNGNSDAGAKKLYQMMDKIRMARTGTKKQGKEINPDKFMPGGLAKAYAEGGKVKGFAPGGSTGTTPTSIGAAANAGVQGSEANLSNWAGPYATNYLAQGQALANMPYQAYMGPLTAGPSALQNKVTQGLESLNFPGTLGQSFTSAGAPTIGADGQPVGGGGIASSYMNPYLKNVLDPQMEELRRQSQINLQPGLAKLTAAGGFGGGRQAIMESEANRNLLQEQNKTVGQGYANAYDKAMQQFNTEQGQAKTLADMMAGQGAVNRGIESEGVAADKAQFEEARANPFKMVQFQQSLLNGMPINATDYNIMEPSTLQKAMAGAGGVAGMFPNTTNLTMDDVTTALKKLGVF
jgi:hypothetical protein